MTCFLPIRRVASLAAMTTLVGGCAHYVAQPLASADAALASPASSVIMADAAKLTRPYLKAEPIDLSAPLTPNAMAIIAVLENPDLKAQRAKSGVTDAQAFQARLLPDPAVQLGWDKLLSGPDEFNAYAGQIGLDINQLRLARVTRQSGDAAKRQVRLDLAWAEWQTAGQARLQGVRVLALEAQLKLAQASYSSAQDLFDRTEHAVGRGDLGGTELDSRRQALLDASTKARTVQQDLITARADLNKLLGLPPSTVLRLAPSADPVVPPAADILTGQALTRRLDLAALRAGYDAAEAEVHKNILEQFPNLSLTVAYARDTTDNRTLGPQVGFSLPLWNRNRGGIAVATATREQLHAEYQARLFQTRAEIEAAVGTLASLRRQRDELVSQMGSLERFVTATQKAAQRGDIALSTAETSAQALRDRRYTLAQLNQQIAEQTIALELLSGGPSEGWSQ